MSRPPPAPTQTIALWVGGAAALAVLGAGLLAPAPPALRTPYGRALSDALHVPLFLSVTWALVFALRRLQPVGGLLARPLRQRHGPLAVAAAVSVALAAATELAQHHFGRTASWTDLGLDCAGIAAAVVAAAWWRRAPRRRSQLWGCAVVLALAGALALVPLALVARAAHRFADHLPLLGGFEHTWELRLWRPQGEGGESSVRLSLGEEARASGGTGRVLRVESRGARWAGTNLQLPEPGDWSSYRTLRFEVLNPGDRFELGLRVDTARGERFTGAVSIAPGANSCTVPLSSLHGGGRSMAALEPTPANRVRKLVMHLGGDPADRWFELDDVRLE